MGHPEPNLSLEAVLLSSRERPALACFDLGTRWTLVTWAETETPDSIVSAADWMERARQGLKATQPPAPSPLPPFAGGWVGWVGYEAGRFHETMPVHPRSKAFDVEELSLWRVNGGLYLDQLTQQWTYLGSKEFQRQAAQILERAQRNPHPSAPTDADQQFSFSVANQDQPGEPPCGSSLHSQYTSGVRSIVSAISQGDVYQVNLAWRQEHTAPADPLQSWLDLRRQNPALRGAFLRHKGVQVLSNSPELFLDVRTVHSGNGQPHVTAKSVPIKGTAALSSGQAGRKALWCSEKERAELTMIVDLVRNDLGRVAQTGSVKAYDRQLRVCGDLLHAEQEVSAVLRPGLDAFDAFDATFPPGSVTGAPKVAAMETINLLEPDPRGVYTGAIGWFSDQGAAHFNVAIRTATVRPEIMSFHVGAGIVSDSVPEQEWQETIAKGRALNQCLNPQTGGHA